MLIRIEFYRYKQDIALYNDCEFSPKELKNQLVEAEIAGYLKEEDNFLEVLENFGWCEISPNTRPQYWYDRDVQCLFRYDEKWDKKDKGFIFLGYKQVKPCLNFRIKMRAHFKRSSIKNNLSN